MSNEKDKICGFFQQKCIVFQIIVQNLIFSKKVCSRETVEVFHELKTRQLNNFLWTAKHTLSILSSKAYFVHSLQSFHTYELDNFSFLLSSYFIPFIFRRKIYRASWRYLFQYCPESITFHWNNSFNREQNIHYHTILMDFI